MQASDLTGTRIRDRRVQLGMKQADLARSVEISPSYLNLIEHNRRRIAGKLLGDIALALEVEVATLTQGAEAGIADHLRRAAAAEAGAAPEADRIDDFVGRFPGWAALVAAQHDRVLDLEDRIRALTDRLGHDTRLSGALHEVLSKASSIRSAAAILVETEDIDEAWRGRFQRNLHGDSLALAEGAQALLGYLDREQAAELGPPTPWEELEAVLGGAEFRLPAEGQGVPDAVAQMSPAGQALLAGWCRRAARETAMLAGDHLGGLIERFGLDPARIAAACDLPVALVCRRLVEMPPQPGQDPLGLVLCDASGRILLRRAGPAFLVPRSGSACPLWPLFAALAAPGRPVMQRLRHMAAGGAEVTGFAIAEQHWPEGAGGMPLTEGWMLILPAETGPETPALQVGSACRVCARARCPARHEPSLVAETA